MYYSKFTLIPALTALLLASCSENKTQSAAKSAEATETTEATKFTTDSINVTDSISVGKCTSYGSVTMLYPVSGPKALVDSVRTWVAQCLGFSGSSLDNGSEVARLAVSQQLDSSKVELTGIIKNYPEYQSQYQNQKNIGISFETEKVITYFCTSYVYLGGAHGSTLFQAATFRADNGSILGWNMFKPESLAKIKELVKNAIKTQYFNATDNFADCLLVKESEFPLPQMPPVMMKDGILFNYQQYEIAPYAAGMPDCTIPYSQLAPYFTASVSELIPLPISQ